ncbi:hypothetical protein B0E38_02569 [Streptomyces sp. 111WW2]|uniref:hypothetical protein n=1 Tax=Streptomyces sp. 111WW2 TaxID=1945515 RepID=UPI000D0C8D89|nr:hypothetical protein [Streptomyces sp. 111WW2]PSK57038.1 hypothetical protein B0E38_02569 [Streptomyces sp. 111WW2]
MTTPIEELRTAAGSLRKLVADLPTTGWGDRPWHVEECSDTDGMSPCPCIVAQGEYREFDQPQEPLIQYVADAETVQHGAYIAVMHPGVGTALADWLDATAAALEKHAPAQWHARLEPQALAVARQINGGAQ